MSEPLPGETGDSEWSISIERAGGIKARDRARLWVVCELLEDWAGPGDEGGEKEAGENGGEAIEITWPASCINNEIWWCSP